MKHSNVLASASYIFSLNIPKSQQPVHVPAPSAKEFICPGPSTFQKGIYISYARDEDGLNGLSKTETIQQKSVNQNYNHSDWCLKEKPTIT